MNDSELAKFQSDATVRLGPRAIFGLARRSGRPGAVPTRLRLCAALAHAAFAAPDHVAASWDAAAAGWLGAAVRGPAVRPRRRRSLPIPPALWSAFRDLARHARTGLLGAAEVTRRTAALGALLDERFAQRAAEAALAWPGIAALAQSALPDRWRLEDLEHCPADSLAREFYRLVIDNGFDLEVLERGEMALAALPAPLGYLNARILQCHDLWHIVAGYQTTGMDEVGISAFQLGQFGHGYSAKFLALVATGAAERGDESFGRLMDVMAGAWRHGRETLPLMRIDWETVWREPTAEIRARFAIAPYAPPHPRGATVLLPLREKVTRGSGSDEGSMALAARS
ncbi:MAG TPA: Coq4 family protein [Caulobacteraceae bacterium]